MVGRCLFHVFRPPTGPGWGVGFQWVDIIKSRHHPHWRRCPVVLGSPKMGKPETEVTQPETEWWQRLLPVAYHSLSDHRTLSLGFHPRLGRTLTRQFVSTLRPILEPQTRTIRGQNKDQSGAPVVPFEKVAHPRVKIVDTASSAFWKWSPNNVLSFYCSPYADHVIGRVSLIMSN